MHTDRRYVREMKREQVCTQANWEDRNTVQATIPPHQNTRFRTTKSLAEQIQNTRREEEKTNRKGVDREHRERP
jgi:hypothetical protein